MTRNILGRVGTMILIGASLTASAKTCVRQFQLYLVHADGTETSLMTPEDWGNYDLGTIHLEVGESVEIVSYLSHCFGNDNLDSMLITCNGIGSAHHRAANGDKVRVVASGEYVVEHLVYWGDIVYSARFTIDTPVAIDQPPQKPQTDFGIYYHDGLLKVFGNIPAASELSVNDAAGRSALPAVRLPADGSTVLVGTLQAGVYIVRLTTAGVVRAQRFVVE